MVAATLRHLRSLRLMVSVIEYDERPTVSDFVQRRDHGWIHTLLEEAENERMHLMYVPVTQYPTDHHSHRAYLI